MKTFKVSSGDLYIDEPTGRFKLIEKEEKLSQDMAEALLTGYETARNFGNRLITFKNFISAMVSSELYDAVNRLQKYQEKQQNMPVEEKISTINAIEVVSVETDTFFYVEVSNSNSQSFGKLLDRTIKTDLSHLLPAEVDWYSATSG